MPTDAEIEAAVAAMRAIRTVGGKVHDNVLRAYARAALEAAERALFERVRKRAELRQQLSNGDSLG
jgi:prophage DNA circulation protein